MQPTGECTVRAADGASVSHKSVGQLLAAVCHIVTAGWCHPASERHVNLAKHSSAPLSVKKKKNSRGGGGLIWTISKSCVLCWAALMQQGPANEREVGVEGVLGVGRRVPRGFVLVQLIDERER